MLPAGMPHAVAADMPYHHHHHRPYPEDEYDEDMCLLSSAAFLALSGTLDVGLAPPSGRSMMAVGGGAGGSGPHGVQRYAGGGGQRHALPGVEASQGKVPVLSWCL